MKDKFIKILIIPFLLLFVCGCEYEETENATQNATQNDTQNDTQKGRCLEYTTEYKLDCGLFVDSESWCKERKYDVCIRWEEIEENNNEDN